MHFILYLEVEVLFSALPKIFSSVSSYILRGKKRLKF